ncbi:MAG: hypothetical protein IJH34_07605 [Romboutsia sp.]|nr:hypothetical protein [Romboutsia sp.]
MLLKSTVDYDYLKKNGLSRLINNEKLKEVVDSNNKDDFRDFIFDVVLKLEHNNIFLQNYYYGDYVCLSDEEFDMFSSSGLEELFTAFGYKCELKRNENNKLESEANEDYVLWQGELEVSKDDFNMNIFAIESMHDSFISIFCDTKIAKCEFI